MTEVSSLPLLLPELVAEVVVSHAQLLPKPNDAYAFLADALGVTDYLCDTRKVSCAMQRRSVHLLDAVLT